jgi:hypothetical protein
MRTFKVIDLMPLWVGIFKTGDLLREVPHSMDIEFKFINERTGRELSFFYDPAQYPHYLTEIKPQVLCEQLK